MTRGYSYTNNRLVCVSGLVVRAPEFEPSFWCVCVGMLVRAFKFEL